MPDGWTITEAAGHLHPPIPRRELARRLSVVHPVGALYGRRGRSHGPGNDPYLVREVGTDLDRRTSYLGVVDA